MARLYANENFPLPVVQALRRLGHDVLTIQEIGGAGHAMSDEDVLAFSRADGRALLTLNRRHFVRLHQQAPEHAGIIVCSFDPDFPRFARRIHADLSSRERTLGETTGAGEPLGLSPEYWLHELALLSESATGSHSILC